LRVIFDPQRERDAEQSCKGNGSCDGREILWSQVNDATPCCVGYCIGPPNRIELVEKRGYVELGGVDRDAEPTGDHFV
jgi:hypothetical protein